MKFSIVIPTYNGERFVEEALLSALNQSKSAFEIIISDDNSSDKTLSICKKYLDYGVKIYSHTNGPSGFVNGWNQAIDYASGEFISILHQDDILYPDFLLRAEAALLIYPTAMHIFSLCNYINASGNILRHSGVCSDTTKLYTSLEYVDAYSNYENGDHIHRCPGVLTHSSIFDKCRYRVEAGHIADDDFFYRVAQHTQVIGLLSPLAAYREHTDSETGHLSDQALVKRLVNDYRFQLIEMYNNTIFTQKQFNLMKTLHKKYSKRHLGYALKKMDFKEIAFGVKNLFFT